MDVTSKKISLQFYDYICGVVGTKRVVKTRRQICNAVDRVMYGKIGTVVSSGSKAEGLDLKGSDYDIMHVFTQCQVYENVNAIGKITNKIHLIMDADDSPPGFTLLQLLPYWIKDRDLIHALLKAVRLLDKRYTFQANYSGKWEFPGTNTLECTVHVSLRMTDLLILPIHCTVENGLPKLNGGLPDLEHLGRIMLYVKQYKNMVFCLYL